MFEPMYKNHSVELITIWGVKAELVLLHFLFSFGLSGGRVDLSSSFCFTDRQSAQSGKDSRVLRGHFFPLAIPQAV